MNLIFSEIYNAYFRALEKMIQAAAKGSFNRELLYKIAEEYAFPESGLFMEEAIKSGEWKIFDESYSTPYEFAPERPLSLLEKRWLKTISLDRRFALFADELPVIPNAEAEEIEPLFHPDDILYPDRFADGDDYESVSYRAIFKKILQGFKENRKLKISYISGKGYAHRGEFIPRRLEYSQKEDKFRLYTGNIYQSNVINVSRITNCALGEKFNPEILLPLKRNTAEIQFEITNQRNCLERALIHFSSFEKETIKLPNGKFLVKMKYSQDDETEIVIRLLQFGQFIKVISPNYIVAQIKRRLSAQELF